MPQSPALGRQHQVEKDFSFELHAVIELAFGSSFNGIDTLERRREIFGHAFDHVAGELKVSVAVAMLARKVAHERQWPGIR